MRGNFERDFCDWRTAGILPEMMELARALSVLDQKDCRLEAGGPQLLSPRLVDAAAEREQRRVSDGVGVEAGFGVLELGLVLLLEDVR